MDSIYLDHNATSLLDPTVGEQLQRDRAESFANPASQHAAGRRARRLLEEAREQIKQLLGCASGDQLIFTSGGSESNYLAICGGCGAAGANVVLSAIEHPSVSAGASYLRSRGIEPRWVPADRDGRWRIDALGDQIDARTSLVSLMWANNETGVIQPIGEAARLCRERGVPLHTDAVQAVGRIPVDFRGADIAALSFTAHKFHGPRGVGGLIVRDRLALQPVWFPGVAQYGLRPGTEDVVLPRAMWRALANWQAESEQRIERLGRMRDQLEQLLRDHLPEICIHGSQVARVPQTTCVSFLGVDRQALLMAADLEGLAISAGSACASGSSEPSPTLQAMGLPPAEIESAVRLSFGILNSSQQLQQAGEKLVQIVRKLRRN